MKGARRDTELAGLKVPAMSADDLNPPDISEIVLGTLQRLLQAFPERTSVAKVFGDKMTSSDLVRVWSWMLQQQLVSGDLAAYFADRAILIFLAMGSEGGEGLRLSEQYFTHEPYALALPRGDNEFRLVVDRTLSRIYRSGDIKQIFANSFGANAAQSDLLKALYVISSLPE